MGPLEKRRGEQTDPDFSVTPLIPISLLISPLVLLFESEHYVPKPTLGT